MTDRSARDPNWVFEIAPVLVPILASRSARIFSKVFPRHDGREMGRRFFGSEVSVLPGLGIGTHFASFHADGKHLC